MLTPGPGLGWTCHYSAYRIASLDGEGACKDRASLVYLSKHEGKYCHG